MVEQFAHPPNNALIVLALTHAEVKSVHPLSNVLIMFVLTAAMELFVQPISYATMEYAKTFVEIICV